MRRHTTTHAGLEGLPAGHDGVVRQALPVVAIEQTDCLSMALHDSRHRTTSDYGRFHGIVDLRPIGAHGQGQAQVPCRAAGHITAMVLGSTMAQCSCRVTINFLV